MFELWKSEGRWRGIMLIFCEYWGLTKLIYISRSGHQTNSYASQISSLVKFLKKRYFRNSKGRARNTIFSKYLRIWLKIQRFSCRRFTIQCSTSEYEEITLSWILRKKESRWKTFRWKTPSVCMNMKMEWKFILLRKICCKIILWLQLYDR